MQVPTEEDGFIWDANCCIKYSLRLGHIGKGKRRRFVRDIYADALVSLLYYSNLYKIPSGYFPFIKNQSYRNLTEAVNELADKRGVQNYYIRSKFKMRAFENLDKLFQKNLVELPETYLAGELHDGTKFFQENEIDICKVLNLQYKKNNIPEDSDIKLLICAHNTNWKMGFIVSDDTHFVGYKELIDGSDYSTVIVPMKDITQIMGSWGWTN